MPHSLFLTFLVLWISVCQSHTDYYSVSSTEFPELNNPLYYSLTTSRLPQEIEQSFQSLAGASIDTAYKHPTAGYYLLFQKPKLRRRRTYRWAIISKQATDATVTTIHTSEATQQEYIRSGACEIKHVLPGDFKRIAIEFQQQSIQDTLKMNALQIKIREQHKIIYKITKQYNDTMNRLYSLQRSRQSQVNEMKAIQQRIQAQLLQQDTVVSVSRPFMYQSILNRNLSEKYRRLTHKLEQNELLLMNMSGIIEGLKGNNKRLQDVHDRDTFIYRVVIIIIGVICIIMIVLWCCQTKHAQISRVQRMHTFVNNKPVLRSMAQRRMEPNRKLDDSINVLHRRKEGNQTDVNEKFRDILDNSMKIQDVIIENIVDEMVTDEGNDNSDNDEEQLNDIDFDGDFQTIC